MYEVKCSVCQAAMIRQDDPSEAELPAIFTIKDASKVYPLGKVTSLGLIAYVCPRCGQTSFFEYKSHLKFQFEEQGQSSA